MRRVSANKSCAPCKNSSKKVLFQKQTGVVAGILLALLPKCPFCYMAFSGTLMLCGNGSGMFIRTFSSLLTQIFSVTFCLLILLFIILNFRDKRTIYAIALAVVGSAMVIYSTTIAGGLMLYYSGVVMIFFGVWINASLLYFINRIRKLFTDLRKEKLWA
jgi:hypothetical protein